MSAGHHQHNEDQDDGEGGWPEDEFDEDEEYQNFSEPSDRGLPRQPSLSSRIVPPLPPTPRESAGNPGGSVDLTKKLQQALLERRSMHNSKPPNSSSPISGRPSPQTSTTNSNQRKFPNVPSVPPPVPPPDEDEEYEAPDEIITNRQAINSRMGGSSGTKATGRPLPPVPQTPQTLPVQTAQASGPTNSRPLPPVPPSDSFDDDEYVAVDSDGLKPQPIPALPGSKNRPYPPLPVSSRSQAPPLPDFDDEEYAEADAPPPAILPARKRMPIPTAGLSQGNQGRPVPQLPTSFGSKTQTIPVVSVTNITEDIDCEYESNDCYEPPPTTSVSKPSAAVNAGKMGSRPVPPIPPGGAPVATLHLEKLPGNRPNSDIGTKKTWTPTDQPEHVGRLKSSSSDASELAGSRGRQLIKNPTSQLATDEGRSFSASGLADVRSRLKKVTPETTKQIPPTRRTDGPVINPVPALPPTKTVTPPTEPAKFSPAKKLDSPEIAKVVPLVRNGTGNPVQRMNDQTHSRDTNTSSMTATSKAVPSARQPQPSRPLPPVDGAAEQENLYSFPWYFAGIDRKVAEAKLRSSKQNGAFMVRRSQKGGSDNPFSVSVFYDNYVYNLRLRKRFDQKYAIGSEKPDEATFTTLPELVSFYKSNTLELIGDTSRNIASGKVMLKSSPPK